MSPIYDLVWPCSHGDYYPENCIYCYWDELDSGEFAWWVGTQPEEGFCYTDEEAAQ